MVLVVGFKVTPMAGIDRNGSPFVCEVECVKRGWSMEDIKSVTADMVESLR